MSQQPLQCTGLCVSPTALIVLVFLLLPAWQVSAQVPLNEHLNLYGDLRFGYFGQEREERTGEHVNRHELRLRTRMGLHWKISNTFEARVRYAGRFSSIDPEIRPGWTTTSIRNNGLQLGEMAFDEAYLQFHPVEHIYVRTGRFLTGYTLPGVINNAIIRHDSPNNDVQWTDGIMGSYRMESGWIADLIMQFHYENWPSNTMRYPMDFSSSNSYLTGFLSIRKEQSSGRVRLIGFDATFSPNALWLRDGEKSHYAAVSGKTALGWMKDFPGEIIWGVEATWSLNRPDKSFLGFPDNGKEKAGGLGFQSNLSFMNFRDGHSLGFIFAALESSLLTSEDYWNNILLWEARYTWRISRQLSTEIRYRFRGDLIQYEGTIRKRTEYVPYVRLTYRFN